jgi:hypothetical protein
VPYYTYDPDVALEADVVAGDAAVAAAAAAADADVVSYVDTQDAIVVAAIPTTPEIEAIAQPLVDAGDAVVTAAIPTEPEIEAIAQPLTDAADIRTGHLGSPTLDSVDGFWDGSCSISGNDVSGQVILHTSTGGTPTLANTQAEVHFNAAYGVAPIVLVTWASQSSPVPMHLISSAFLSPQSMFRVAFLNVVSIPADTAVVFNYHVLPVE